MKFESVRSVMAVVLAAALTFTLVPAPVLSADSGVVTGRVLSYGSSGSVEAVTIVLVNPETQEEVRSVSTNDQGSFRMDAPAGRYVLLIETDEGAFLASDSILIVAGVNRPLVLTLDGAVQPTANLGASGGGLATWAKWLIVGGIVIVGVVAVDQATEETEPPASAF